MKRFPHPSTEALKGALSPIRGTDRDDKGTSLPRAQTEHGGLKAFEGFTFKPWPLNSGILTLESLGLFPVQLLGLFQ
jgi:hypothetical protein